MNLKMDFESLEDTCKPEQECSDSYEVQRLVDLFYDNIHIAHYDYAVGSTPESSCDVYPFRNKIDSELKDEELPLQSLQLCIDALSRSISEHADEEWVKHQVGDFIGVLLNRIPEKDISFDISEFPIPVWQIGAIEGKNIAVYGDVGSNSFSGSKDCSFVINNENPITSCLNALTNCSVMAKKIDLYSGMFAEDCNFIADTFINAGMRGVRSTYNGYFKGPTGEDSRNCVFNGEFIEEIHGEQDGSSKYFVDGKEVPYFINTRLLKNRRNPIRGIIHNTRARIKRWFG